MLPAEPWARPQVVVRVAPTDAALALEAMRLQGAKVPAAEPWLLAVGQPVPTVAAPKDYHAATVRRVAEPWVEMQQPVAP